MRPLTFVGHANINEYHLEHRTTLLFIIENNFGQSMFVALDVSLQIEFDQLYAQMLNTNIDNVLHI